MENRKRRLLVFNCHEAWVHQLRFLDHDLDIICGLPGRYTQDWDIHIRPVPPRARLIRLEEALACGERYDCIIAHNPTDLLDIRTRTEPRLLMIHVSIQARIAEEHPSLSAEQAKEILHRYVTLCGAHVASVTYAKGKSWGFGGDVLPVAVDPNEYPLCTGETICGLRVANFILQRKTFLDWSFHERAFAGLPIRIVGHNPGLPGVAPSRDWDHLKDLLRTSRFYIHTANPDLEDGYNMAVTEAMAAGLPVLGNKHPTSIVEHGVSGFLSDDPAELRDYAQLLLADRNLALRMGRQARLTVQRRFSVEAFRSGMEKAIELAKKKRELLSLHGPQAAADIAAMEIPPQGAPVKPAIVEIPRQPGRTAGAIDEVRPAQER
ncbi:MAG: glycosyltransferase [Solirubrobacterales bacterium]